MRAGGALLIAAAGYHLAYSLLHEEGRRDFRLMLPTRDDVAHVWQNLRFFLGVSDRRPAFGRFTYFEKFDYWAVFWGCAIMIATGLALWFHGLVRTVARRIPASAFDAFKEAHAHEAVLAFLAIVIWHAYNVHLGAGRFPWNWAWIHGRVRREELEAEHPLDSSLKNTEAGETA